MGSSSAEEKHTEKWPFNILLPLSLYSPSSTPAGDCRPSATIAPEELMFDKVVTPSDVGKLNRLVIPKQHAERHFPLDSSTTQCGLHLCFLDPSCKQWRFRYSYWKSSQSYVITKGWSRFVKEKQLRAGDTVSFWRCGGEGGAHTAFFISWTRRYSSSYPWSDLVSFPVGGPKRGFQSASVGAGDGVISRIPVAKRVRLFGVNLDCYFEKAGSEISLPVHTEDLTVFTS